MSTDESQTGTPTPPEVARHATQSAALERIALLGVFGANQSPRALIRLPMGRTQTVMVGDRINGGVVTAIGADQVVLSHARGLKIMHMPRG